MDIISLSNHIVRKALCLSLNEMAVLCDIKQMSQNPKYGYQCIKSKEKIAEWLDLSRATVFNAISALESKGYVERTAIGVKPSQFIFDLDSCQDEIGIYVKNGDVEMISKKILEVLDGQSKIYTTTVQNLDGDSLNFRLGQSKIYTQDIHIDIHKDNTEQPVVAVPKLEVKIHPFQTWIKTNCPRVSKLKKQLTYEEAEKLLKDFDKEAMKVKLFAMENKKKLDYVSVNLTLRNWMQKDYSDSIPLGSNAPKELSKGNVRFNVTQG